MNRLVHVVAEDGWSIDSSGPVLADAVSWRETAFLSGRADVDRRGAVRHELFSDQVAAIFADLDAVLARLDASRGDVLRVECFLADRGYFNEWNAAWVDFFPPPRPARTTLVSQMSDTRLLVELQVTAALGRAEPHLKALTPDMGLE